MKISKKLLAATMATIIGATALGSTAIASFSVANAETLSNAQAVSLPAGAKWIDANDSVNKVWWKIDGTTLTIGGQGNMPKFSPYDGASVPWEKYSDNVTKAIIEEGVTSISVWAFHNFSKLTSVFIANTVKYIGNAPDDGEWSIGIGVFTKCSSLESITIPKSVELLNTSGGFSGCTSLKEVVIENPNLEIMFDGEFYGVGRQEVYLEYVPPCKLVLPKDWKGEKPDANGNWQEGRFNVEYRDFSSSVTSVTPTTQVTASTPVTSTPVVTTPSTPNPTTTTSQTVPSSSNLKGSMAVDTANYKMDKNNRYQIGVNIQKNGKRLSGAEVKALIAKGTLKVTDSRTGSIVDLKQLDNGDFLVTGKNYGSCYIVYTIYDNDGNEVNHASVKIDVEAGVKQGGLAVRNTSLFDENLLG